MLRVGGVENVKIEEKEGEGRRMLGREGLVKKRN